MTNVSFSQSTSNLHQLKGTFDFAAYAGSPNKIKHVGKDFYVGSTTCAVGFTFITTTRQLHPTAIL